jgi:hypothetical protein
MRVDHQRKALAYGEFCSKTSRDWRTHALSAKTDWIASIEFTNPSPLFMDATGVALSGSIIVVTIKKTINSNIVLMKCCRAVWD